MTKVYVLISERLKRESLYYEHVGVLAIFTELPTWTEIQDASPNTFGIWRNDTGQVASVNATREKQSWQSLEHRMILSLEPVTENT